MHLDFGFHFFIQKEIIDIKIVIDFSQYLWGMCRDDKLNIGNTRFKTPKTLRCHDGCM